MNISDQDGIVREISELDKERIQVGDLGALSWTTITLNLCCSDQIQGFRPNSIIFVCTLVVMGITVSASMFKALDILDISPLVIYWASPISSHGYFQTDDSSHDMI